MSSLSYMELNLQDYKNLVDQRLESWRKERILRRLWAKDYSIWFPEPTPEITDRLGWLILPEVIQDKLDELELFAKKLKEERISHLALLGMGGSSLAPEVFQTIFGNAPGYPELLVLDSTHPSAVSSFEEKLHLPSTLFLVSSKSGTTIETLSFFYYFWDRVRQASSNPGHQFIAITDPQTPLKKLAQQRMFRAVFEAPADVGGRFSALTVFGLVPAALVGVDIHKLIKKAVIASKRLSLRFPERKSPGTILGAALGEITKKRNKVTFLTSPCLFPFPEWLEQLIAESLGKDNKGIIPVTNEPWAPIECYGNDRIFIGLFLAGEDGELKKRMAALKNGGHPTILFKLQDKFDIGQEIFHWEVGIALAGSVMRIHPFNQPDVLLAKEFAQKAMKENHRTRVGTIQAKKTKEMGPAIKHWISQRRKGDYVAIQAYLAPSPEVTEILQNMRLEILKHTKLATSLCFGPSFLHSTGQLHKGGPNEGLFLQVVDEPSIDLAVPETNYTFDSLIHAQSKGDYEALVQRRRRVLRINLGDGVHGGLEFLLDFFQKKNWLK